ncbi:MAG: FAD-binding oxidoreductase, partial [Planctomycetes bacterium]|nr:FAD-binding oxidoreductase [Planctomycetota bacterium]
AVRWQEDQLIQETAEFIPWSAGFANEQARSFWSLLVEFQSLELGQVTFKANLRGSRMAEFLSAASREAVAWAVQAHAGTGVAYGHAPHCADQAALRASLANLRSLVVSLGGNLVLRRCPTDWKGDVPVWGEPRSDLWLMRAIKHKLDPKGILNPGRFVD